MTDTIQLTPKEPTILLSDVPPVASGRAAQDRTSTTSKVFTGGESEIVPPVLPTDSINFEGRDISRAELYNNTGVVSVSGDRARALGLIAADDPSVAYFTNESISVDGFDFKAHDASVAANRSTPVGVLKEINSDIVEFRADYLQQVEGLSADLLAGDATYNSLQAQLDQANITGDTPLATQLAVVIESFQRHASDQAKVQLNARPDIAGQLKDLQLREQVAQAVLKNSFETTVESKVNTGKPSMTLHLNDNLNQRLKNELGPTEQLPSRGSSEGTAKVNTEKRPSGLLATDLFDVAPPSNVGQLSPSAIIAAGGNPTSGSLPKDIQTKAIKIANDPAYNLYAVAAGITVGKAANILTSGASPENKARVRWINEKLSGKQIGFNYYDPADGAEDISRVNINYLINRSVDNPHNKKPGLTIQIGNALLDASELSRKSAKMATVKKLNDLTKAKTFTANSTLADLNTQKNPAIKVLKAQEKADYQDKFSMQSKNRLNTLILLQAGASIPKEKALLKLLHTTMLKHVFNDDIKMETLIPELQSLKDSAGKLVFDKTTLAQTATQFRGITTAIYNSTNMFALAGLTPTDASSFELRLLGSLAIEDALKANEKQNSSIFDLFGSR